MKPGQTTRPPASITSAASGGTVPGGSTAVIDSPSTITSPDLGWAPVPSTIKALMIFIRRVYEAAAALRFASPRISVRFAVRSAVRRNGPKILDNRFPAAQVCV
ncbi:hypothetical protein GCM10028864_52450 [Microlunatus parietis]